ncbi:MAG: NAD(P)H-hydrate dehydratase [Parashewanella sp.]
MTTSLPSELYSVEQVRQAEIAACKAQEKELYQLVEKAGLSAFDILMPQLTQNDKVIVLVGNGNNGADGLVLARLLDEKNIDTQVMGLQKPTTSSEFQQAKQLFEQQGGEVLSIVAEQLTEADYLIDAMFGTGLTRPLSAEFESLIQGINQCKAKVISLDVPSGINADTGYATLAVEAVTTLCFGALKQGLFTYKARQYCGEIVLTDIGLQPYLPQADTQRVDCHYLDGIMTKRSRYAHKGDSGKVAVVGGDVGMSGAVRLCSEASLRAGSGLVSVVSRPENQSVVVGGCPELLFCPAEFVDMEVYQRLGWATALVLGPGLGRHDWGLNLFKATMLSERPLVIDADGLNILSRQPQKQSHWVLTPHAVEAARLLDCKVEAVNADRFKAARDIQRKYGGVVVLKGAGTIIDDGTQTFVAAVGNPGLASGGCGDVLAGIIGALMAQGFTSIKAAIAGVVVHGCAADIAAQEGERGMLASDLLLPIRQLVNQI